MADAFKVFPGLEYAELGVAFEHHGDQHYRHVEHFQKTEKQFKQRKRDDTWKRRLCKKHGVVLIAIPQIGTRTKLDDLADLIFDELEKTYWFSLTMSFDKLELASCDGLKAVFSKLSLSH